MKRKQSGTNVSFQDRLTVLRADWRHKKVPFSFTGGGVGEHNLGAWCANQRHRHNKGNLSTKRFEALCGVQFRWGCYPWYVKLDSVSLQDRVCAIEAYKAEYGHVRIPTEYGYAMPAGRATLVYTCSYCQERVAGDQSYWEHLRDDHGDELTPEHRGSFRLGHWIRNARQREKQGKLPEDIRTMILDQGVRLTIAVGNERGRNKKGATFEQRHQALRDFKGIHGHIEVPVRYSGLGTCLVCDKPIEYGKGYIVAPRTKVIHLQAARGNTKTCFRCCGCGKELNAIGKNTIKWKHRAFRDTNWKYTLLCGHYACKRVIGGEKIEIRKLIVDPIRVEGAVNLGTWVQTARARHAKGTLPEDEVRALDEIGFVWKQRGFSIDERIEALKEFKEEHKNLFVPMKYTGKGAHRNLGGWACNQRNLVRRVPVHVEKSWCTYKSLVPAEHKEKLDGIGFEWNGRKDDGPVKKKKKKKRPLQKEQDQGNPFYWLEDAEGFDRKRALVKYRNTTRHLNWFIEWVESYEHLIIKYEPGFVTRDHLDKLEKVIQDAPDWKKDIPSHEKTGEGDEKKFLLSRAGRSYASELPAPRQGVPGGQQYHRL